MLDRPTIDITIDKIKFFEETVPELINSLNGDETPLWGMMTAQHMVEHLDIVTSFCTGEVKMQLVTPEEKLPRQIEFLYSNYAMPQNFKAVFLPKDELISLKFKTLAEAKENLFNTLQKFLTYIQRPEFTTEVHPVFGALDTNGWLTFHLKHYHHHLKQFGLV